MRRKLSGNSPKVPYSMPQVQIQCLVTILVSTVVLAIILSFTSYEINLEPHAPSLTTNLEPVNGRLLSWNLRDFSKTKNARELEWISKIIKDFDLVAIQEVVAGKGGARAVALLADELNRTGAKWDYRISNPTQSPSYKTERYAFLWKTGKVKIVGSPWLEKYLSPKDISGTIPREVHH
ncbi:MAG: hypothetical protein H6573_19130 [Lewinellaceae bacterium]|nr:hypothetical protein [Lewinellaceae bacterium]